MKKVFALVLTVVMLFAMAGCDLFSDNTVVQFEELYTHQDPKGLSYDERKVMINKDFGPTLEEMVNSAAYPDTMKYDAEGNVVGLYDYDPETGVASGYMDLATGEFVAEEVELGKPDESLMLHLSGNVTLGCVIYGKDEQAVTAYLYALLGDGNDKEAVCSNLEMFYGLAMEAESDTVLVCQQDEAAIRAQFEQWQELYGQTQSDRSAAGYAENLKLDFGLKNYGVNPYKPYSGVTDPEDLTFDEKVILTSSGSYSFTEAALEANMVARTDVLYGYEGKVVAHFIYYEYQNKAAADKLMNAQDGNFFGTAQRISDTTVQDQMIGQQMQDLINSYIGYNVLQDDSMEEYVRNVEETYFAMIWEQ